MKLSKCFIHFIYVPSELNLATLKVKEMKLKVVGSNSLNFASKVNKINKDMNNSNCFIIWRLKFQKFVMLFMGP